MAFVSSLAVLLPTVAAAAEPAFTSRVDESETKPVYHSFVLNADNSAARSYTCRYMATFDADKYRIAGKVVVPPKHMGMIKTIPLKDCTICEAAALKIDCDK